MPPVWYGMGWAEPAVALWRWVFWEPWGVFWGPSGHGGGTLSPRGFPRSRGSCEGCKGWARRGGRKVWHGTVCVAWLTLVCVDRFGKPCALRTGLRGVACVQTCAWRVHSLWHAACAGQSVGNPVPVPVARQPAPGRRAVTQAPQPAPHLALRLPAGTGSSEDTSGNCLRMSRCRLPRHRSPAAATAAATACPQAQQAAGAWPDPVPGGLNPLQPGSLVPQGAAGSIPGDPIPHVPRMPGWAAAAPAPPRWSREAVGGHWGQLGGPRDAAGTCGSCCLRGRCRQCSLLGSGSSCRARGLGAPAPHPQQGRLGTPEPCPSSRSQGQGLPSAPHTLPGAGGKLRHGVGHELRCPEHQQCEGAFLIPLLSSSLSLRSPTCSVIPRQS